MNKSKLLHDGPVLLYSTAIANRIGRNEAIVLQQIHYWLGVPGGKVVDGTKWFWKTYSSWSEELLLSVSTVRRVISHLRNLGLIKVSRLAAKTYYQANWYTLNQEAVFALIQNEQIDVTNLNTSTCSKRTDDIIESSSADFSSEKQAAGKEKCLEPDWDKVEQQVSQWEIEQLARYSTNCEQPTVTRSVDDKNEDFSSEGSTSHEDAFPSSDDEQEAENQHPSLKELHPNKDAYPPKSDSEALLQADRNCENQNSSSLNSLDSEDASPPNSDSEALLQADRNSENQNSSSLNSIDSEASPPSDEPENKNQDFSTLESRPSVDTTPPPSDEREEENIKLCEVRDVVGSLTPRLKKLIADFTLGDLRKALALYRDRCSKQQIRDAEGWLKKCLQQRWWQDKKPNHTSTDARQDNPEPKRATEKLTQEQKVWYESAIALGICLPAAIEELPIRMGLVCARVVIPNRRPFDPPFEVLPIQELMARYPINIAAL